MAELLIAVIIIVVCYWYYKHKQALLIPEPLPKKECTKKECENCKQMIDFDYNSCPNCGWSNFKPITKPTSVIKSASYQTDEVMDPSVWKRAREHFRVPKVCSSLWLGRYREVFYCAKYSEEIFQGMAVFTCCEYEAMEICAVDVKHKLE